MKFILIMVFLASNSVQSPSFTVVEFNNYNACNRAKQWVLTHMSHYSRAECFPKGEVSTVEQWEAIKNQLQLLTPKN